MTNQVWENVWVSSNGESDDTARFFVSTDDGSGLVHSINIERDQVLSLGEDFNEPTGAPHYRRDRSGTVSLTEDQVNDLGWCNE